LAGEENLSERRVSASLPTFGPASPASAVRPVQDIQSQEAISRNRTFSLMANEPGMVWQSNAHLYILILTGVQYPMVVTRLSGSWNAICRAEAGPLRPGL
jgi:hypothetical protein